MRSLFALLFVLQAQMPEGKVLYLSPIKTEEEAGKYTLTYKLPATDLVRLRFQGPQPWVSLKRQKLDFRVSFCRDGAEAWDFTNVFNEELTITAVFDKPPTLALQATVNHLDKIERNNRRFSTETQEIPGVAGWSLRGMRGECNIDLRKDAFLNDKATAEIKKAVERLAKKHECKVLDYTCIELAVIPDP